MSFAADGDSMGIRFLQDHENWDADASVQVGANRMARIVARVAIERDASVQIRVDITEAED